MFVGKLAFLEHTFGRVFVGRLHVIGGEAEAARDASREALRVVGERPVRWPALGRDQRGVAPDRLAVRAPVQRERPARQRLAGIPFALAVMQEPAGRETVAQAAGSVRRRATRLVGPSAAVFHSADW